MKIFFYTLILLHFFVISCTTDTSEPETESETDCIDTDCKDYTSQQAAQLDFDNNPICRADLDADKDGIACEELGNEVTTCPPTANCGCSNKRKADCEEDPCCQWIVGEGCKCND